MYKVSLRKKSKLIIPSNCPQNADSASLDPAIPISSDSRRKPRTVFPPTAFRSDPPPSGLSSLFRSDPSPPDYEKIDEKPVSEFL